MAAESAGLSAASAEHAPTTSVRPAWIRFDRNELAGSFGDIGTDLPLLLAMIPAAGLDSASVFIVFGALQILTGLLYGLPMPMQPLKAMAVLVIANAAIPDQRITGDVLFGGGLAIGVMMLALTLSGALDWLVRVIPHCVVRGIQLGLGLKLASLALEKYVPVNLGLSLAPIFPSGFAPPDVAIGYAMAAVCFVIVIALRDNRRFPAALFVIGLGVAFAFAFKIDPSRIAAGVHLASPTLHMPQWSDVKIGLLALALPQLPLSLANSVVATNRTLADLFPHRQTSIRRIGLTYAVTNLIAPFFSGIPVCHGCGGLAGHYAFGARTGGSVIIYGAMYVTIGLLLSGVLDQVVAVFPQPVLGVVLLCEALLLMQFVRDVAAEKRELGIALLVGVLAFAVPQGFIVGLNVGTVLVWATRRRATTSDQT